MATKKTTKAAKPKQKYHPIILDPSNAIDPKAAKRKLAASKPVQKIETNLKKEVLVLPHDHDSYFVYLKNPLEYRRHILESSRKILFSLKSHQKVLLIRQKKLEELARLKNSVKELLYLNKKFNEMLPKYNMAFIDKHHQAKAPNPVTLKPVQVRKPVEVPKQRTELDKLEESLASIEKKLRSLQ